MKKLAVLFALALLLVPAAFAAGLEIKEIRASVEYDEAYTYRLEHRDRKGSSFIPVQNNSIIDVEVLPGSNITFTLKIENTFSDDDLELKGVFATMTLEDIDDGADLEEESLEFDLEPGEDFRDDVKFSIPLDVDAGTYNTVIVVEGDDKNGTSHRTEVIQKHR